jgi:hypothetical protein
MELDPILKRLQAVTGQKSNRALSIFLGLPPNTAGNWKSRGTIPYQACLIAEEKTGYLMRWLLTGEGAQKQGEIAPAVIDEDKLINDFAQTIVDGMQLGFLRATNDTTEETINILGKKLYNSHTGRISIPKSKTAAKLKYS